MAETHEANFEVKCSKCGKECRFHFYVTNMPFDWEKDIRCPDCWAGETIHVEQVTAPGWIQYQCRGCGGVASALQDSLCGHYQVCETCARKKPLGDSNMLPPGQIWLKEGSPGSGRYA